MRDARGVGDSRCPPLLALVFAKAPRPGHVKTRLAATEGPLEAARIYRCLAADVVRVICDARDERLLDAVLCLPPEDLGPESEPWLPALTQRWSQGDGDLGARLARAFAKGFDAGYERVFAVGTDVVGLTPAFLRRVHQALDDTEAVMAPTPDGGYGLLACHARRAPDLDALFFHGMPWSTAGVPTETRRRAHHAGCTLKTLEGLADVDVAADLAGVLPTLAVLIPALNEAPRIARLLAPLLAQAEAHPGDVEIIVADGGSADETVETAHSLGARVITSARGRGTQLRAAATAARARWLWTLHADMQVEPDALRVVLDWCRDAPRDWAACPSRFEHPSPFLRFMECVTDGRPRVFRTPYGDQGLLIRRAAYEAVGGYPDLPLMEDVEMTRRLRSFDGPGRVPTKLRVDARRWRALGILGTTLQNLWTLFRWQVLRTDAATLAARYRRGDE